MPNRVDAAGVRPAPVRPDAQQANAAQQVREAQEAEAQQADRVEISEQARLQAEQNRPQVGENPRGAAVEAPSARPPEAGDQGAVNEATAQQAEQLREEQAETAREAVQQPAERQGNIIDVVG